MVERRFWVNKREALLGVIILLLLAGTANVFSSSFVLAETNFNTPYFFIKRHAICVVLGLIGMGVASRIEYHWWQTASGPLLVFVLLTLTAVFFLGPVINGARRWLQFGGFQFQPSEFAKLTAIILEAGYLSFCAKKNKAVSIMHSQMGLIFVMALLVEKEPDGTTAFIILGVPLAMMLVSTMTLREKGYILLAIVLGVVGLCMWQPYRLARVMSMLNPWADIRTTGYQVVQSMAAIGSGGFWGVGLGMGVSKYQYLPEAHTDFAFAVFCQENGFIAAFGIFILFGALTLYGARIANAAKDSFGQYLAAGIIFMISGQAVLNLLMVSGWCPVVGIPLPFISYGGTSLIMTLVCIGILINIDSSSQSEKKLMSTAAAPPPGKYPRLRRVK